MGRSFRAGRIYDPTRTPLVQKKVICFKVRGGVARWRVFDKSVSCHPTESIYPASWMKRRNNVRCASEFNTIKDPSPLCCGSSSWLLAYFACNLLLTIYNKLVLAGDFPFPYTLTAIHCLFATIGSWACLRSGGFTQARLSRRESIIIGLFSAIFTVNILVSNVSLYLSFFPEFV